MNRKEPVPVPDAASAEPTESGQAAFAAVTMGHLTATSACSKPGTLTIALDGELDIATAPALERLLSEIESDRWPTIVLDLRHLSFIDSSGIRVLLAAHQRIRHAGGHMVVRHTSRPVRRTLAAIGADSILDLDDVIDEPSRNGAVPRPHPGPSGSGSSGEGQSPPGEPRQPRSTPSLVTDPEPAAGPALMEVTNAVVTACKTHTGRGPNRARAHLRPDALYLLLEDWMTVAEHTLLACGREDLIAESRRHLHDEVAEATRATVEHATGRIVTATRSRVEFNRETAILAFVLGRPVSETAR